MKLVTTLTLAVSLSASAVSAASIAEIAAEDGRFTTLVAAADAAGLVETLSSDGTFTVFAPTDDAFAALPEGTVESLLEPGAKDTLTEILTYHVLGAEVPSGDIAMGTMGVDTVAGKAVCVTKDGGAVILKDGTGEMANVIIADIKADNGVIHVIDRVIMPGDGATC